MSVIRIQNGAKLESQICFLKNETLLKSLPNKNSKKIKISLFPGYVSFNKWGTIFREEWNWSKNWEYCHQRMDTGIKKFRKFEIIKIKDMPIPANISGTVRQSRRCVTVWSILASLAHKLALEFLLDPTLRTTKKNNFSTERSSLQWVVFMLFMLFLFHWSMFRLYLLLRKCHSYLFRTFQKLIVPAV